MYQFERVREHIEVYQDGRFIFSADNMREAMSEIEEIEGGVS